MRTEEEIRTRLNKVIKARNAYLKTSEKTGNPLPVILNDGMQAAFEWALGKETTEIVEEMRKLKKPKIQTEEIPVPEQEEEGGYYVG